MGESDVSLDSATLISAAILLPLVSVIAGCAICRRLCGGSENDDEERQPLLTEERQGSQSRIERVENEEDSHQRKEPERRSPQSHTAATREQLEHYEEDTRQQEAQPVVVAEASLIPDLLQIDEQEPERSHQSEPDILEPRPFADNAQFPQHEHKEVTLVKERAQQELPPSQLPEGQLIPNLEDIPEQLITTDREADPLKESEEINVKFQAPTLHAEAGVQLIPNLEDVQEQIITPDKETEQLEERKERSVEAQATTLHPKAVEEAIQSSTQDQEQLIRTLTVEDNDEIQIETEPEQAIVQTVKEKDLESFVEQKLEDSITDKELRNETPENSKERPQEDSLAAKVQDGQTADAQATVSHTEQHEHDSGVVSTPPTDNSSPVTTATEEQKRLETTENASELPVQGQQETTHSDDLHGKETTEALNKGEESKKEEVKTEEQRLQPQEESSSSTQHQSED